METILNSLPAIITAVGAIVIAWFSYNQYSKNKITDMKVKQLERHQTIQNAKRSSKVSFIVGELYRIMLKLNADRVYIIQPHPLDSMLYLTVELEARDNGVTSVIKDFYKLPIKDFKEFSIKLMEEDFMYLDFNSFEDSDVSSLFLSKGANNTVIKRLSYRNGWIGSVCVDFLDKCEVDESTLLKNLTTLARKVQASLPPIITNKELNVIDEDYDTF